MESEAAQLRTAHLRETIFYSDCSAIFKLFHAESAYICNSYYISNFDILNPKSLELGSCSLQCHKELIFNLVV